MLAVESKNRSRHGRCFSSSPDPLTSDQWEAPYIIQARWGFGGQRGGGDRRKRQPVGKGWWARCRAARRRPRCGVQAGRAPRSRILPPQQLPATRRLSTRCSQNFLYEKSLQDKPIYVMGISAGAAFAVKVPRAFYEENFGGVVKVGGVLSGARGRERGKGGAVLLLESVLVRRAGLGGRLGWLHSSRLGSRLSPAAGGPNRHRAEVNAVEWDSWGLIHRNGSFKYPDWPPTAFISMPVRGCWGWCWLVLQHRPADGERGTGARSAPGGRASPTHLPRPDPPAALQRDTKTHALILDSVIKLRQRGRPSDWLPVRPPAAHATCCCCVRCAGPDRPVLPSAKHAGLAPPRHPHHVFRPLPHHHRPAVC